MLYSCPVVWELLYTGEGGPLMRKGILRKKGEEKRREVDECSSRGSSETTIMLIFDCRSTPNTPIHNVLLPRYPPLQLPANFLTIGRNIYYKNLINLICILSCILKIIILAFK